MYLCQTRSLEPAVHVGVNFLILAGAHLMYSEEHSQKLVAYRLLLCRAMQMRTVLYVDLRCLSSTAVKKEKGCTAQSAMCTSSVSFVRMQNVFAMPRGLW